MDTPFISRSGFDFNELNKNLNCLRTYNISNQLSISKQRQRMTL